MNFWQAPPDVQVVGIVAADPVLDFESLQEFRGEPNDTVRMQIALLRGNGKKFQAAMVVNVELLRMFNLAGENIDKVLEA